MAPGTLRVGDGRPRDTGPRQVAGRTILRGMLQCGAGEATRGPEMGIHIAEVAKPYPADFMCTFARMRQDESEHASLYEGFIHSQLADSVLVLVLSPAR